VDGERLAKINGASSRWYLGAELEYLKDTTFPAGKYTGTMQADVRRDGDNYEFLHQDAQGSLRLTWKMTGNSSVTHDFSPFGQALAGNGLAAPEGKGYINERVACPREGGGPRDGPAYLLELD
jgi:hypothetical protein